MVRIICWRTAPAAHQITFGSTQHTKSAQWRVGRKVFHHTDHQMNSFIMEIVLFLAKVWSAHASGA